MGGLLDVRMHDGSRHFAALERRASWYAMRDHVLSLPGARLESFLCDGVADGWIDFSYAGHRFDVNAQESEYWFFVRDPVCSDSVLRAVLAHFERIQLQ